MQFNKLPDGTLEDLPAQNVDTGMGLERTVAVLNGFISVYQTDAFTDILQTIADLSGNQDVADNPIGGTDAHNSARIIADHIRSGSMILADKVAPSNLDQGYILRRLLRRAIRHGRKLGVTDTLCVPVAKAVIAKLGGAYPELVENTAFILDELQREEDQFRQTLEKGEKKFHQAIQNVSGKIDGELAFDLFQTYGFPLEMTQELAHEAGLEVDEAGYHTAFKAHQEKSRTASAGKFKGGMSRENIEQETRLHTATHLLLAGLREVLGDHVHQAGSNITAERLRFDFSHGEAMTPEQKAAVEQYVNDAIAADAEQILQEVAKDAAQADDTIEASFWDRYPDTVKVYTFRDSTGKVWTRELCGGPHVASTSELEGTFKIKKEQSSGRGVRRIKAVLI